MSGVGYMAGVDGDRISYTWHYWVTKARPRTFALLFVAAIAFAVMEPRQRLEIVTPIEIPGNVHRAD